MLPMKVCFVLVALCSHRQKGACTDWEWRMGRFDNFFIGNANKTDRESAVHLRAYSNEVSSTCRTLQIYNASRLSIWCQSSLMPWKVLSGCWANEWEWGSHDDDDDDSVWKLVRQQKFRIVRWVRSWKRGNRKDAFRQYFEKVAEGAGSREIRCFMRSKQSG